MQSKCRKCGIKKSRFVKEQEARKNLKSKTPLGKILLLNVLFWVCKMNEIVNKFFWQVLNLWQKCIWNNLVLLIVLCGPFTKKKEKIEKFMRQGIKNELDKACCQYDMPYGKSKNLVERTQLDKVLKDKMFETASDPKYDGCQRGLPSMFYKYFDKKLSGSGVATEPNYQLAKEFHKQIIRKFKNWKVYSSFRDSIWGVDLADRQSLSKYSKGIKYL